MVKRVAILGSTGSVGRNALHVIDTLNSLAGQNRYEIKALSCHSKIELLAEQVRRYKPKFAVVTNADYFEDVCGSVGELGVKVLAGQEGLVEVRVV